MQWHAPSARAGLARAMARAGGGRARVVVGPAGAAGVPPLGHGGHGHHGRETISTEDDDARLPLRIRAVMDAADHAAVAPPAGTPHAAADGAYSTSNLSATSPRLLTG